MANAQQPPASGAKNETGASAEGATVVEAGNYEVIRKRLVGHGQALRAQVDALNERRQITFGGTELAVTANTRVRTQNNCVPRDIVQVGGHLLLGYNVFIGLKQETAVDDVFSVQAIDVQGDGVEFHGVPLAEALGGFLADTNFVKDFTDLYRYYRDTRLDHLRATDTQLLAVFRIGPNEADLKVFRWRIGKDDQLTYVDNRGDRDLTFPPSHDFVWKLATREMQVQGAHPHINIDNRLFVETVGGDLTIKVENNTLTGEGIYSEPVDDANQTLDDAEIHYAVLGSLVLLKVRPYRETVDRYLVFNTRTRQVVRIDAIGRACVQLPEDHGIIFPGGYYLQAGDYKVFDNAPARLRFKRVLTAPNGEDVLYVFYEAVDGVYALLPYNLIRKEVQSPIYAHGYSLFEDGRLVVFRRVNDEATRVHPMQVWQTPFTSVEFAATAPTDGSFLSKVGNADLVRGISDAYSICRLIDASVPSRQIYEDLIAAISRMGDSYYWVGHAEVKLAPALAEVGRTVELIVDEFEKVVALRERAAVALREMVTKHTEVVRAVRAENLSKIEGFMTALTRLRTLRGELVGVREVRYIDVARLDALDAEAVEHFERLTRECVQFLLRPEALSPLNTALTGVLGDVEKCNTVKDIEPLRTRLSETATGLDLLTEVIAGLQIDDATARTRILEGISDVFGLLNRVRATLEARRRALMGQEGRAEFGAQFKLFGQSVASALSLCDTPERCDQELGRLMVQLEELEARFSEFDEFLGDLASKREEVLDAFGARKQTLLDERQRRAGNIRAAADRIFEGITRRVRTLTDQVALHAYFASDAMVLKLGQLADQLGEIGENVKAEELRGRLKSARQDALRGLRDKLDLFAGGDNLIQFGQHRFAVNTQPLELTLVPRGEAMALHLTGTDFFEPVEDATFLATADFWAQNLVSEDATVYRAEYLAATVLFAAERGDEGLTIQGLLDASRTAEGLGGVVRQAAQTRYDEGYERGLHDVDATQILDKLLAMRMAAGLLRYAPAPRALAALFWAACPDADAKIRWQRTAQSLGRLRAGVGRAPGLRVLGAALAEQMRAMLAMRAWSGLPELAEHASLAGRYLVEELTAEHLHFTTSREALDRVEALWAHLDRTGGRRDFDLDLRALEADREGRVRLARDWLEGLRVSAGRAAGDPNTAGWPDDPGIALEAAVVVALGEAVPRTPSSALTALTLEGMLGVHPRITDGKLAVRLDAFTSRLTHFIEVRVPGYRAYRAARHALIDDGKKRLRLEEFQPKIMSAFVRNKLINDVYLPIIGNNFAKQMGAAGANKRTDLMGLLLLTSPPGYGKTTLMEYVAQRLGLVFVKVNGPSLGHDVRSLDPAEAPNATARQEVEKVNLAFEMGNNVMLYLDDVQHLCPEFLQKFISLCDAQRRVEGVWRGRTRTYDLRGKKFCIVMAGNPYTETGDKFVIPDMLANRADTYNLGEILSGARTAFELSYLENALTSNSVLAPLATRSQSDVYKIIAMADGEQVASTDLEHGYAAVELEEIVGLFKKLRAVQRVVLSVNQAYVESANTDDKYRTEPAFKLQGSYRNMAKLTERVVAAMTPAEVEALLDDHYRGESQTLTTGAENNLLKLAELRGRLTPEQAARIAEVRRTFKRVQTSGGDESDPVVRVVGTLAGIAEQIDRLGAHLAEGGGKQTAPALARIADQLAALPTALQGAAGTPTALTEIANCLLELGKGLAGIRASLAQGGESEKALRAMTGQMQGIREAIAQAAEADAPRAAPRVASPVVAAAPSNPNAVSASAKAIAERLDGLIEALKGGSGWGGLRPPPLPGDALASSSGRPALAGLARPKPAGADTLTDFPKVAVHRDDGTPVGLENVLVGLMRALEAVARPQLEVRIDNRAPAGVEELLAQQIQIVERTLVPLVQTTTARLGDSRAITAQIENLTRMVAELDAELRGR